MSRNFNNPESAQDAMLLSGLFGVSLLGILGGLYLAQHNAEDFALSLAALLTPAVVLTGWSPMKRMFKASGIGKTAQ